MCQVGDLIDSRNECRIACGVLDMPIVRLKERRPCYRAGNGKCKQDGRHGSSATMICKNKGNSWFSKLPITLIPSLRNSPKHKICMFFYLDLDSPYFIEDIGQTSCQNGTKIMNAEKCKTACIELERNIGKMKSGRECYIAGNGKCRQAGRKGKKSSLVCKTRGNPDIFLCNSAINSFDYTSFT